MALLVSACAHNIQINPDLNTLRSESSEGKIDAAVGYYISDENRMLKVTTPGGGGDKISYQPYKDTEGALNTILSDLFVSVFTIKDLNDKAFLEEKKIAYIFKPEINTDSSSDSIFTWPATDFTMNLTCEALDNNGNSIWVKTVTGEGKAEFSEFTADFGLSGRRATQDAFEKMKREISASNKFNN